MTWTPMLLQALALGIDWTVARVPEADCFYCDRRQADCVAARIKASTAAEKRYLLTG